MSRFNHIDKPSALPGSCTSCGRATDPNGFVDTGLEIDFHGAIQFCYRCVQAMYGVFGFDATARSIINEDTVANARHLVDVVKEMKKDNAAQLNALLTHVASLDSSFVQTLNTLERAAGAREAAIAAANERAAESSGFDELGLDLDELGTGSHPGI